MKELVSLVTGGKLGSPVRYTTGRGQKELTDLQLGAIHDLSRGPLQPVEVLHGEGWLAFFFAGPLNAAYLQSTEGNGPDVAALYPTGAAVEQALAQFKDKVAELPV